MFLLVACKPRLSRVAAVAVEAVASQPADLAGRNPVALVVRAGDLVVRTHAHAIGGAEAAGKLLQLRAVRRHFKHAAVLGEKRVHHVAVGGKVEVAHAIGLQIESECVISRIHIKVAVERLVVIGLAIAVQVMQPRDPVAAQHVDGVVDDTQSQGLVESGREPLPRKCSQRGINAGDNPDITAQSRNGAASVAEKVERRHPHPGTPRIRVRERKRVHGVSARLVAGLSPCDHRRRPLRRPAIGQRIGIHGRTESELRSSESELQQSRRIKRRQLQYK